MKSNEPFCWESREFLRKLVHRKEVTFVPTFVDPVGGHSFGDLLLADGTNVAVRVSESGWVHMRASSEGAKRRPEFVKLSKGVHDAEIAHRGMFAADAKPLSLTRLDASTLPDFYEKSLSGKKVRAVVEWVHDGAALQLATFTSTAVVMFSGHLFGIRVSPNKRREITAESGEEKTTRSPPDAGELARRFTYQLLCQIEIEVVVEGLNSSSSSSSSAAASSAVEISIVKNSLYFQERLLREGLATVDEAALRGREILSRFLRCQEEGSSKRKTLIQSSSPSSSSPPDVKKEMNGVVVNVIAGDLLDVVPEGGLRGKEQPMRIGLSDIRAPKDTSRREGGTSEPLSLDSKEYTRKKTVGRKVHLILDYSRKVGTGQEDRLYATVLLDKENVALSLVTEGLAKVMAWGGPSRSSAYPDLLAKQDEAIGKKLGIHAERPAGLRLNEISGAPRARSFLPFLLRAGRMEGVAEFVSSCSRFRVYIPSQSCLITLVLSGITTPRGGSQEPFAEESLKFSRDLLHQRDIQLAVDRADASGAFVGVAFHDGKLVNALLVENGFARLRPEGRVRENPYSSLLIEAEATAIAQKLRVFSLPSPEGEEEGAPRAKARSERVKPLSPERVVVTVREMLDATRMYIVRANSDDHAAIERAIAEAVKKEGTAAAPSMTRDTLCIAQFSGDGRWYRSRVVSAADDKASVFFVDYGNSETVPASCLRAVAEEDQVFTRPFQALLCSLAFVRTYGLDTELGMEAAKLVEDMLFGRASTATVRFRSDNVLWVSIAGENGDDVAHHLVRSGLARVEHDSDPDFADVIKTLESAETEARENHRCMWAHGDLDDDVAP